MKANNRKGQASLSSVFSKKGIRTFSPAFCRALNGSASQIEERLSKIGIATCEELLSYEYTYGIEALATATGLDKSKILMAVGASKKNAKKGIRSDFIRTGLFKANSHSKHSHDGKHSLADGLEIFKDEITLHRDEKLVSNTTQSPPKCVSLINQFMPPIRNQGERGTCVVFATCALLEYELARSGIRMGMDFSEQYHYWLCKEHDQINEEGTFPFISFSLCNAKGLIPKEIWSYIKTINKDNPRYHPPPDDVKDSIRFHPTKVFEAENSNNIDTIKRVLADGHPVAIGIPVFDKWNDQPETKLRGNYLMPLEGEKPAGYHCLVLAGYNDDLNLPSGGGEFLVRNSYGKQWGRLCRFGSGYGTLPYGYVKNYNYSAYWLDVDQSKVEKVIRGSIK